MKNVAIHMPNCSMFITSGHKDKMRPTLCVLWARSFELGGLRCLVSKSRWSSRFTVRNHRCDHWSHGYNASSNRPVMCYEIILVEDGGGDGSWDVLRELQAKDNDRIVVIQLMRNYGQHNALMCGFRHARGEYIVTIDDDLQNPPEEIPKLLNAIQTGRYDLVYGTYASKKHSFVEKCRVGSRQCLLQGRLQERRHDLLFSRYSSTARWRASFPTT